MKLEYWFDFASTYSYLSTMRIKALAEPLGIAIEWRPFLLGPIFRDQGWMDSPFNLFPAKGRYMWRDMERSCDRLAIPFRRPSQFPRNGLLAARIVCAHSRAPWVPEFTRAVFRANFADDLDIADSTVLAQLLGEVTTDAAAIIAAAQTEESKLGLRKQTELAARRQIFGAPSFIVNEELYWGNDRLEEALEYAKQLR